MSNDEYFNSIYSDVSFSREDESDDSVFYQEKTVHEHLDDCALKTIEGLIERLIIEEEPVILDLMAGKNSHIPSIVKPARIEGLGLDQKEMEGNSALSGITMHDLNTNPALPYPDATFDIVLNTTSVNYIARPREVFNEVVRVLKPGGLFLVVFSNRMIREKTVRVWKEARDDERVMYVEDLFVCTDNLDKHTVFISRGRPRPADDKYFGQDVASDPVYAVYTEKKGRAAERKERPRIKHIRFGEEIEKCDMDCRVESVGTTLQCPHCGEKLLKWQIPDYSHSTWAGDLMHVCFNDSCPKFVNGFDVMCDQGNIGYSFRFMFDTKANCCKSLSVNGHDALKEGIVE